jgi:uncharacterized protein (DUF1330 family)
MNSIRLAAALVLAVIGAPIAISHAAAQGAPAPAYVFVQSISITDAAAFERYQALARDAIVKYGGRFLARGAKVEILEGQGDSSTLGLLQFPSIAAAKTWFTSPEYQEALKMRRIAGQQRIFMVEGLAADVR